MTLFPPTANKTIESKENTVSENLKVEPFKDVREEIAAALKILGSTIKLSEIKFQQKPGYVWFWVDQKNGLNTAKTPLQLELGHIMSGGLDGDEGITYKNMTRVIEALWKRQMNMVRRERISSRKRFFPKRK
jgi:hypothetical protein